MTVAQPRLLVAPRSLLLIRMASGGRPAGWPILSVSLEGRDPNPVDVPKTPQPKSRPGA